MSATTTSTPAAGSTDDRPEGRRGRYRENLQALQAAQKPSYRTPAYSRLVNRPVARRVAAAGDVVGLTPNGATAISATSSAAGFALVALAEPSWPIGVAVAILLAFGYVMDSVDGQLARLRGRGSVAGEWLDHTVDCMKNCVLHLVVLISFYRFLPVSSDLVLLVPMAYLVVDVTYFFGVLLLPYLRAQAPPSTALERPRDPAEAWWRKWLILPTDYGMFCWMFVLLGAPLAFLAGYVSMFVANALLLALASRKWWRELRALDAQVA